MFLQGSVCPQGGWGCLSQCMLGYHTHPPPRSRPPLGADTPPNPPEQTPPSRHPPHADTPRADTPQEQTSPGADTPLKQTFPRADTPPSRPPLEQTPPADTLQQTPPPEQTPPPRRDGHCCGLYASYWKAFLFQKGNTYFLAPQQTNM